MEELLKQAQQLYPIGTKFHTLNNKTNKGEIYEIKRDNFEWWINSTYPKGSAICERSSSRLVYYNGIWAEIVSYPDGHIVPDKEINNYQIY